MEASPLYGGEEPEGLNSVGASSPSLKRRLYFAVILLERAFLNRADPRLVLHLSLTGCERTHLRPRAWCPEAGGVAWGQRRPPTPGHAPHPAGVVGGPLDAPPSLCFIVQGSRPESSGKSCRWWECHEEGEPPRTAGRPEGREGCFVWGAGRGLSVLGSGSGGGRPAGVQPL